MANSSAGFGFLPFGRLEGGSPTAGLTKVNIASSDTNAIGRGDLVQDSTAQGSYVTLQASGVSLTRGVFWGCEFYSPSIGRVVWQPNFPGSVQTSSGTADAIGYIYDDPQELFIAKGSTSGIILSSYFGLNIGFMSSMGVTTGDIHSLAVLASSTVGSTSALPFRLVDYYSNYAPPGTIDGVDNTSVGNIVVVSPNNWSRKNLTARSS